MELDRTNNAVTLFKQRTKVELPPLLDEEGIYENANVYFPYFRHTFNQFVEYAQLMERAMVTGAMAPELHFEWSQLEEALIVFIPEVQREPISSPSYTYGMFRTIETLFLRLFENIQASLSLIEQSYAQRLIYAELRDRCKYLRNKYN